MLTERLHLVHILLDCVALQCLCMLQVCKSVYLSIISVKSPGDVTKEHQMKLDGAVVHVSLHPEPSKCIASFAVGPPVVADFATDTVKPLPAVVMGETRTHRRTFLFSVNMQPTASSSDKSSCMQRFRPMCSATSAEHIGPVITCHSKAVML